jgi:hypothetical protein
VQFMKWNLIIIFRAFWVVGYLETVLNKTKGPVLGLIARVGDQGELEKRFELVLLCTVIGSGRGKHLN